MAAHRPAITADSRIDTDRIGRQLIWLIILTATAVIPVYYSAYSKNPFRLPKEILIRAEALILGALTIAWPWRTIGSLSSTGRRVVKWILAILIWTTVTTVTSTARALSLESLFRVLALALVFAITYILARGRSPWNLLAVIVPALANALVYVTSSLGESRLFTIATDVGDRPAAFLGNVGDIATFFVTPTLACIAWAIVERQGRIGAAIAAAILGFALIATQTITALVALASGVTVLVWLRWKKRALPFFAAVALAAAGAVYLFPPLQVRARVMSEAARQGNYDAVLSGRLLPFSAAWRMFLDHPVFGVGPGCYGFQYHDYKLLVARRHPTLVGSTSYPLSFGEAHNDHLQTLATTGLPGYLLMLGVFVWCASLSLRRARSDGSPANRFARILALPLVVSFAIMAGASFPLELAAVTSSNLYVLALVTRWSEP